MPTNRFANPYQKQAVLSASPEQLILKLYDLAIGACHQGNRSKVRAALAELMASLNMEAGGEIAQRLHDLYTFCMDASVSDDLEDVIVVLGGLRAVWKESVMQRKAA